MCECPVNSDQQVNVECAVVWMNWVLRSLVPMQGFPTEEGRALELAGRTRNEARYFVLDKELLDASPIKCNAPFKLSMS